MIGTDDSRFTPWRTYVVEASVRQGLNTTWDGEHDRNDDHKEEPRVESRPNRRVHRRNASLEDHNHRGTRLAGPSSRSARGGTIDHRGWSPGSAQLFHRFVSRKRAANPPGRRSV